MNQLFEKIKLGKATIHDIEEIFEERQYSGNETLIVGICLYLISNIPDQNLFNAAYELYNKKADVHVFLRKMQKRDFTTIQ